MAHKYKTLIGVLTVLIFVVSLGLLNRNSWDGSTDFRMAIAADDGLWLVSISPERKMTNVVKIDSATKIWIPGGLGWYQLGVLKKIVNQENMGNKWDKILFYNFGFVADKLLISDTGMGWDDWSVLSREMGLTGYGKYLWVAKQMLVRKSTVSGEDVAGGELLDEIMPRDFADSGTLTDSIGVSVVNNTGLTGLASFISRRLEWSGVGVNSNENGEEKIDGCEFRTSREKVSTVMSKVLVEFMGCRIVKRNTSLVRGGDELFLGERLVQMINYSSYLQQDH